MSNQLSQMNAKQFFMSESTQAHMENILGEKAKSFATTVLGIVANNFQLQKCEPASIYQCALVATTLDLPLNANLGYAHIIPYGTKAQFQISYKGFLQLAQRSGKFAAINAVPVYANDTEKDVKSRLLSFLPTLPNGEMTGYCAYFRLLNGYEHTFAMSVEELKNHGKKYSKSYNTVWTTNFEAMARKTVLKLLLQRYAPMSIEMERAAIVDQSAVKNYETMELEYVDSTTIDAKTENSDKENEQILNFIQNAKTTKQLCEVEEHLTTEEQKELFQVRFFELDQNQIAND
jgi:recombination protein RecT